MQFSQPYESPALREAIGPALRPGGLHLTERAARYCNLAPGEQVLDVGCGTGTTAAFLEGRFGVLAVGIDFSTQLMTEARKGRPSLPLVRGDGACLPFAPGRFAAVFCECVLSLLENRQAALTEFHRVLRPGGYLVVSDLYRCAGGATNTELWPDARGCLKGMMPRENLERLLDAAGFGICLWEDQSEHLKALAAQLVWHGIRTQDLWGIACMPDGGMHGWPGYALLVGCKRNSPHG